MNLPYLIEYNAWKKIISILTFLVKVVNPSIYYRIRKMLISCVKLDHALYSISYGILNFSLYKILVSCFQT